MKFFDKKIKVGFATFFLMLLIILEFGILDEMLFTFDGLSAEFKTIKKSIGYNFCVMSIIIYVISVGYMAYVGYHKNWGGLIGMMLISAAPIVGYLLGLAGSAGAYNILFGWGTAHLLPMFTLFGLLMANRSIILILCIAILVLYLAAWLIGYKAKKIYEAKNPW